MTRKNIAILCETLLENSALVNDFLKGKTIFETIIRVLCAQNTSVEKIEKTIENLKICDLLAPEVIFLSDRAVLEKCFFPTGYVRKKIARVLNFLKFLEQETNFDLEKLQKQSTDELRNKFLAISGISLEIADSILLYAFGRAVFVVDSYTYRIAFRHSFVGEQTDYCELQDLFSMAIPVDIINYQNLHNALVNIGKNWCHKTNPLCSECILCNLLPDKITCVI